MSFSKQSLNDGAYLFMGASMGVGGQLLALLIWGVEEAPVSLTVLGASEVLFIFLSALAFWLARRKPV